jgi:type I restriction-modification system DNA methylase subunit
MDMPDEKSLDRYFISRSLDNLKHGGTMALIAHSGILANKSNAAWRLNMNRKARFTGAVKLNDRSFNHTHTAIQPDILLFKKHPEGIEQCLQTFSLSDMERSNYAQEDWINGAYFFRSFQSHYGHSPTG